MTVESYHRTKSESIPGREEDARSEASTDVVCAGEGGRPASCARALYLVNSGRDTTFRVWTRKQRRTYASMKSWVVDKVGAGKALLFVTLTSSPESDRVRLRVNHRELVRRVYRRFGYQVDPFIVETDEGLGVLHCLWAVEQLDGRMPWVPVEWLRTQWVEIHHAWNVHISYVKGKRHAKNVTRYMVNQYMAGQDRLVRATYDWRKCRLAFGRGWSSFKRMTSSLCPTLYRERRYGRDFAVRDWSVLPIGDLICAWQELIEFGWCKVLGAVFRVEARTIVEYRISRVFSVESR